MVKEEKRYITRGIAGLAGQSAVAPAGRHGGGIEGLFADLSSEPDG